MNALSGLAQVQSRACYLVIHSHYKREEAEKGSSVAIPSLRKHRMGTGWGAARGRGPRTREVRQTVHQENYKEIDLAINQSDQ